MFNMTLIKVKSNYLQQGLLSVPPHSFFPLQHEQPQLQQPHFPLKRYFTKAAMASNKAIFIKTHITTACMDTDPFKISCMIFLLEIKNNINTWF